MFRAGEVRVITASAREDGKSVRLAEVMADARWAEAVKISPLAGHFLSAMCVPARPTLTAVFCTRSFVALCV
jgi:hypothetical protein